MWYNITMYVRKTPRKRPPRPGEGRPSTFTQEIADEICKRKSKGESLRSICRDEHMPGRDAIADWLITHKEFAVQYEKSCNQGYEEVADEIKEIADNKDKDESPMRSRLRTDVRKWYLSKVLPKKYGEKLDITSGGEKITPLIPLPPREEK